MSLDDWGGGREERRSRNVEDVAFEQIPTYEHVESGFQSYQLQLHTLLTVNYMLAMVCVPTRQAYKHFNKLLFCFSLCNKHTIHEYCGTTTVQYLHYVSWTLT